MRSFSAFELLEGHGFNKLAKMSASDVTKMKVADLKRELKLRGLVTTGNKTELQERLQSSLLDGDISLEDAVMSGDELLDDDGDLSEEDAAKILDSDEHDLLQSPDIAPKDLLPNIKTASAPEKELLESSVAAPKKLILKRKNSFTTTITQTTKENDSPTLKASSHVAITVGDNDKKAGVMAKVAQLTLQERLELRAKKFGIANAEVTAKKSDGSASSTPGASIVTDEKQIEILKKRAERFGCVVSSKIAKLDIEEKKMKRKERFGTAGTETANTSVASSTGNSAWAEKARQRMERFKTTPNVKAPPADK